LLLLGALPLLVTRLAPLQDWPNHVARIHILIALLRRDAFWTQFYQVSGFLVPNVALDLVVPALARAGLPVPLAAQLFLITTYLVFVGGFCALVRALGTSDPTKLPLAILLFYGNALFWGLVTYVLAVGLMFGLLAAWLGAARPRRRLSIAAAGSVTLLFTHVVAAVAWILLLGIFDLCRFLASQGASQKPMWQRTVESASWLVALGVIAGLLHAMPGGTGHDFSMSYAGAGPGAIIGRKLELFGKLLLGGSLIQDGSGLAALFVCAAVLLCARPRLAAALALAAAALLVLTLVAPERIGTGSVLDTRLAILPLLLLAAAVRIAAGRLATGVVAATVLARTLVLASQWHAAGLVFREFRQQAAGLPAGSMMMAAYGTALPSLTWQQVWSPPITEIATQVVFRDIFVPAVFANPAEQPIALRAAYAPLAQPWNLSDAAHLHATAAALGALCDRGVFRDVYLTVLYPGSFLPGRAGTATLYAAPDFLILDACRLPR
jgi:hypothetical protein